MIHADLNSPFTTEELDQLLASPEMPLPLYFSDDRNHPFSPARSVPNSMSVAPIHKTPVDGSASAFVYKLANEPATSMGIFSPEFSPASCCSYFDAGSPQPLPHASPAIPNLSFSYATSTAPASPITAATLDSYFDFDRDFSTLKSENASDGLKLDRLSTENTTSFPLLDESQPTLNSMSPSGQAKQRQLDGNHRPRNHVCETCGGAFLRTQDLSRHMATHSSKRFLCPKKCGSVFARADGVTRHIRKGSCKKVSSVD